MTDTTSVHDDDSQSSSTRRALVSLPPSSGPGTNPNPHRAPPGLHVTPFVSESESESGSLSDTTASHQPAAGTRTTACTGISVQVEPRATRTHSHNQSHTHTIATGNQLEPASDDASVSVQTQPSSTKRPPSGSNATTSPAKQAPGSASPAKHARNYKQAAAQALASGASPSPGTGTSSSGGPGVNKFKLLNKTELCKFFMDGSCKRSSGTGCVRVCVFTSQRCH